MSLYSFDEFIQSKPKNTLYLADTSFLISSLKKGSKEYELRDKLSGIIGLIYNVIIRKELIHYTRYQLFAEAMENKKIQTHARINKLWDITKEHDQLKQICNEGYAELFREVFGVRGELLQNEVDQVLKGCTYADGKNNAHSSSWNR